MLLGGIALGLILGLLVGGRLGNLAQVRLRWAGLLFVAVIVRFGTEILLDRGVPLADLLRLPLFAAAFATLAAGLWVNRRYPGLAIALVGIILNGVVVVVNGGHMPVWAPSLAAAQLGPADLNPAFNILLFPTGSGSVIDSGFLLHLGPLADIIPIDVPVIRNVASVGDLFLTAGLAFFLFASLVRPILPESETRGPSLIGTTAAARLPRPLGPLVERGQVRAETGLGPGLADAAVLDRPLVLGGRTPGLSGPARAALSVDASAVAAGSSAVVRPTPDVLARVRRHPYVRLALNGPFSALWTGQVISLFGDRVHQLAIAFLVLGATNSAIAVGLTFVAATLPNLVFGPLAGTLVDRWDQKETMVVSDLLRASCVLLIPVAASVDLILVYPLVFAVTTISIFFRPARTSVIPRIVEEDELVTANSATWLGETLADVLGYPLAGLFVAFLGSALPIAFWFDAATYLASALLIAAVAIPPVLRSEPVAAGVAGVLSDLKAGWHFLRHETVLLANTLQGVAGQFAAGMLLTVTPIYARDVIASDPSGASAVYGALETALGIGNLVGGFLIGLAGARLAKGRLVILGYMIAGLCTIGLALVGNLPMAFGLLVGGGIGNMVWLIPSQTLFQERTPADMIGRVVGFRFALVGASLTLAMAVGGFAVELGGLVPVLVMGGLLTTVAGLAGWFVPEVRKA